MIPKNWADLQNPLENLETKKKIIKNRFSVSTIGEGVSRSGVGPQNVCSLKSDLGNSVSLGWRGGEAAAGALRPHMQEVGRGKEMLSELGICSC